MKDKQTSTLSSMKSAIAQYLIIFFATAWLSRELFHNWFFNAREEGSWLIFLIWVLPVIWQITNRYRQQEPFAINTYILYASITMTLLGVLGSLRTLCYCGFATLFFALLPPRMMTLIWALSSLVWMPIVGWFAIWYFYEYSFYVRLAIVALTSGMTLYLLREEKNKGLEHE